MTATRKMASASTFVVVWEWMNEFGRWRPYEPHITNFIERNHQQKPTNQINLGTIDNSLAMYSIDFMTMCQVRFGTGTARPIRKRLYSDTSPPGKGIVWQWEGDAVGQWHTYDMEVACIIEDHFSKNTASPGILDLSKSSVKLPYILDLTKMLQKRIETGRVRTLRRELLTMSYPMVPANQQGITGNVSVSAGTSVGNSAGVSVSAGTSVGNSAGFSVSGGTSVGNSAGVSVLSNSSISSHTPTSLKQNTQPPAATNSVIICNGTNSSMCSSAKRMKLHHNSAGQSAVSSTQQNYPQSSNMGHLLISNATVNQATSNVSHTTSSNSSNMSGLGPMTRKRLNLYLSNQNQNLQGPSSSANAHFYGPNLQLQSANQMPNQMFAVSSNQIPGQSSYLSMQSPSGGHTQSQSLSNMNNLHPPQRTSNNILPSGALIPTGTLQYLGHGGTLPPGLMFPTGHPPHLNLSQFPGQMGPQSSVPGGSTGQPYPGSIPVPGSLFSKSKGASRISPVVTSATNVLMSPAVPMLLPSSSAAGSSSCFNLPREDRIPNNVPKNSKKDSGKSSNCDIFENYVTVIADPPDEEDCCICCEKLSHPSGYGEDQPDSKIVYKLSKCSHMFHKLCLVAMYESGAKNGSVQCPTCKAIYGEKHGNCPRGVMEYHWMPQSLPGHEDCQSVRIVYHVSQGIQGTEHPHPGKRFSARGFPRVCYLPDNIKGRKVLKLLIVAWKRRLTFTIGTSTTTGESDTVTWNEIHHKTEFGTNYSGHGYPDDKYLDNALMELAVHGVTESDL